MGLPLVLHGKVNERLDRTNTKFTVVRIQGGHVTPVYSEALNALPNVVAVTTNPRHPHVIVIQGECTKAQISEILGPDYEFTSREVTGNRHSAIPFMVIVK